jgi:3-hydroxyisobutyrate dehydrogenase-like beta-hydroxyacid dehydrogenase
MYNPDAPAHFSMALGRKDVWLAVNAAYEAGAAVPVVATALESFSLAMREHQDQDITATAAFITEESRA